MRGGARLLLAVAVAAAATLVLVPWNWLAGRLGLPGRAGSARAWNRIALRALGWRVRVVGSPALQRPLLLAANHVSWADVVVFAAQTDAAFVAKSDVAGWPLFGLLARLHEAVFIEREQRRTTREQAEAIAARLAEGKALILFPEGTTADGNHLLPFKTSLFAAVDMATGEGTRDVAVQPVAIAYTGLYGLPLGRCERSLAAWVGSRGLVEHLRLLSRHGPLDVVLHFGEPLSGVEGGRKQLAHAAGREVKRMLAETLRG